MAAVIISLIITVGAVAYFIADCTGKLNREYIGTGNIYLAFPVLHALAAGISSAVMFDIKPDLEMSDDWGKKLIYIAFALIIAVPEIIVSVIGAVKFMRHSRKSGYSDDHIKLGMTSAALSIPFAVIALVLAIYACIYLIGAFSVSALMILLVSLCAFCIGFVIIILFIPFIMAFVGISLIGTCLPLINLLVITAICFGVLYCIAAYCGISSAVSLCKEGTISKKKAILYSVLSLFIFTNLYALSQMNRK
ncbi:MAG: hypothetical protein PUI48_00260 [Oscillospiraceae bacterium]|nr:hypothetical protein [Oscillospiraceae bacterium]MDY6207263.1 hypothetical protein [Oscillospiraceae bacterium]